MAGFVLPATLLSNPNEKKRENNNNSSMATRKRKQPNTVPRPKKRKVKSSPTTKSHLPYPQEIATALQMKVGSKQVVQAATALYTSTTTTSRPLLLDLGKNNLVRATMICRPSKRNRSPYVADIQLEDGRVAIAHVPCMDMGGKCIQGASLLLKIATDRKGNPVGSNALGKYGTPKCEFITQLLWNDEQDYSTWVVAHPSLGEKIAESITAYNLLPNEMQPVESYEREVRNICGSDMRTDFVLTHTNGSRSVMEVKTVVDTDVSQEGARLKLAQHRETVRRMECDERKEQEQEREAETGIGLMATTKQTTTKKKKKKKIKDPVLFVSDKDPYRRAGIFPWGSCKQKGPDGEKVVSARAIKHVDELRKISAGELMEENEERLGAAVLFVVGRKDVEYFKPNIEGCSSFAKHLKKAKDDGVHVMAHRVEWGEGPHIGKAYWAGALDVEL